MLERVSIKCSLLLAATLLLSLSFAPIGGFYCAWVGLIPWLLVVREARSNRAAFLWSWLGGALFFTANMWWLFNVTVPGSIALIAYLGAFFGYAALIFRGGRLLEHRTADGSFRRVRFSPIVSMVLMAMVWIALEYIRGNWSMFGNQGLPWLNLGVTQTPVPLLCQIADIGGVYAVSFWIVLINAAVFLAFSPPGVPGEGRGSRRSTLAFAGTLFFIVGTYGAWRLSQTQSLSPGPTIVVVQPNYPQSNDGGKGAPREEILDFHLRTTTDALKTCAAHGQKVDLVVWSETMMPPLNASAIQIVPESRPALDALTSLAFELHTPLVVGFEFMDDWQEEGKFIVSHNKRNSVLLINSTGTIADQRYDKIHLVPFGEFIPFSSIEWIHSILLRLGPSGYENYVLQPGQLGENAIFKLDANESKSTRIATPICFEDLVSDLVAAMVRGDDGGKRVDLLVNLTNDGWFRANEMPQHFQAAVLRSIENRVPMARSVNQGVSGFIDSMGRSHDTIAPSTAGWSASQVMLDSRVSFYTRHGDLFVIVALAATLVLCGYSWVYRKPRV